MVISKSAIERIKRVLKKNYAKLALGVLGVENLSEEDEMRLKAAGIDLTKKDSILDSIYNYNYINDVQDPSKPDTLEEANAQQDNPRAKPRGDAHEASYEHLNSNMQHLIEKHRNTVISKVEGLVRDNNSDYKYDALQNLDRPDFMDEQVKESTVGDLKRRLRDASGDVNRNWKRIAVTTTSEAIGMGSVDRIVKDNREKDLGDVYIYRISNVDSALCKFCRKFYLEHDGTPAVYRLSTILGNGSNYGKKTSEWKAVSGNTHPNERCSQIITLPPGWKVLPGGKQTFIGLDAWQDYIREKVRS